MGANLQAGSVGLHHPFPHLRERVHLLPQQTRVIGIVIIWVEEICGARSQGPVSKSLGSADSEICRSESVPDSNFRLFLPVGYRRSDVYTRGELAILQKLAVTANVCEAVGIFIIHILNAGHTELCGTLQGASHGLKPLVMRRRRNHLEDNMSSGVLERARGISLGIANDGASRWIGSLRGHTRQTQSNGVGQRHVAVVVLREDRRVGSDRIDGVLRWQLGWSPFGLVPIATLDPFTLRCHLCAVSNSASKFAHAGGIVQLDLIKPGPRRNEVHVSIVETRQEQL